MAQQPTYEELKAQLMKAEAENAQAKAEIERLTAMVEGKIRATVAGQSKPKDTALKVLLHGSQAFADAFNNTVLKEYPISPDCLIDMDSNESSVISIGTGTNLTLQLLRDVVKGFVADPDESFIGAKTVKVDGKEQMLLAIFGVENQMHIDYKMPLRIIQLQVINYSRQANAIENRNKINRTGTDGADKSGEYESHFKKTDRITRVICLVIYYGEQPWDGPLSLEDMYSESGFPSFGESNPMHLLDVRHMTEESLEKYSDDLKPLFGCIKYEKNPELLAKFIQENAQMFSPLPRATHDALMEVTKSPILKKMETEYNIETESGGVDYMSAFDVLWEEAEKRRAERREAEQNAEKKGAENAFNTVAERLIKKGMNGPDIADVTGYDRDLIDTIARRLNRTVAWG